MTYLEFFKKNLPPDVVDGIVSNTYLGLDTSLEEFLENRSIYVNTPLMVCFTWRESVEGFHYWNYWNHYLKLKADDGTLIF